MGDIMSSPWRHPSSVRYRYKNDNSRIPNTCVILFVWVFTFWHWVNHTYSCPSQFQILYMYTSILFASKKIECRRLFFSVQTVIPRSSVSPPPVIPLRLWLCERRVIWSPLMYQRTNAWDANPFPQVSCNTVTQGPPSASQLPWSTPNTCVFALALLSTLQHVASPVTVVLQHLYVQVATHSNALSLIYQILHPPNLYCWLCYTTTRCNTLQHAATRWHASRSSNKPCITQFALLPVMNHVQLDLHVWNLLGCNTL